MLNIKINGQTFNDPKDFNLLKERLYLSKELGGFVLEIVGTVTFTGDAYEWLRTQMVNDLCTDVRLTATRDGLPLFDAKIFLTEIEWMPQTKECLVELAYDGYMSEIDHNKKIQCFLNVPRSKNDLPITVNPQTNFRIPDIDNVLANDNINRRGVYVFDAFVTLIEFMTDGAVSFRSEFFDYNGSNPPDAAFLALFTGKSLRETTFSTFPNISFHELYQDLKRLFNLSFSFERDASGQYLRIEPFEYYKQVSEAAYLPRVKGVKQNLDENSFPAKVTFGSAKIAKDKTYLEEYRFLTMEQEEYHLGGQCNSDTELSLELETLITDPNIIQDVVPTGSANDEYDKDIFLIAMDPTDPNRAKMVETPTGLGDYYINDLLTNEKVALRWFNNIPLSIYAFLGVGGNGCFIGTTGDMIIDDEVAPLFNSRVFRPTQDTGGGFNNANGNYASGVVDAISNNGYSVAGNYPPASFAPVYGGFYTAPFSLVYSFEAELYFELATWTRIYAMVISPTNTVENVILLASQLTIDPPEVFVGNGILNSQDNIYHLTVAGTTYIAANNYLAICIDAPFPDIVKAGSTLEVFDPLGGRWVTYDEKKNFLLQNRFEYPIDQEKWQAIKANPNGIIGFDMGDDVRHNGWVTDISRNHKSGKAEIKLNSKL